MNQVWEFDIGVSSHAWLRRGAPVVDYWRVTVLAESYQEAELIAYWMAAGTGDVEVTEILWRY